MKIKLTLLFLVILALVLLVVGFFTWKNIYEEIENCQEIFLIINLLLW